MSVEIKNNITRTRIDKIIIKADYCGNTFGVSPCTATGEKCYNTFPSCKDSSNYTKSSKDYEFVSGDIPAGLARKLAPARPYLKPLSDLPTEIKENDTVVKVLKATLLDEPDKDYSTDPYYSTRSSIKGTYWKKWLARNKNYKGRIIEQYEAFYDFATLSTWERKFVGRIETISINNNSVTIEATDLLKKLSEHEYPLESKYSLQLAMGKVHACNSQSEMLALQAVEGDFAERNDFSSFGSSLSFSVSTGGSINQGVYFFIVYAYDIYGRVFARRMDSYSMLGGSAQVNAKINVSWPAVSGASYYKIYKKSTYGIEEPYWIYEDQTSSTNYTVSDMAGDGAEIPTTAESVFKLSGNDPTNLDHWEQYIDSMYVYVDQNTDLDASGYLMIEDEIIYYGGILSGTKDGIPVDVLIGVKRHQFNTEANNHAKYTKIHYMLNEDPNNGFTIAKKILQRAGIEDYADPKFDDYETIGTDINFSCNVITKKTKLNIIYFDLINVLGCMSWPGEDGSIKILKRDEEPVSYTTITDKANIIDGSGKVDLNEASRFTSWLLYWNKWDVDADINDVKAYSFGNNLIDADAENENEYGEKIEDVQFTLWINENSGTRSEINNYINTLLSSRKSRTRDAQTLYECDLEMKDGSTQTGDLIKLSTNDLQYSNGSPYSNEIFRVIKKTPRGNKIGVKLIKENQLQEILNIEE